MMTQIGETFLSAHKRIGSDHPRRPVRRYWQTFSIHRSLVFSPTCTRPIAYGSHVSISICIYVAGPRRLNPGCVRASHAVGIANCATH